MTVKVFVYTEFFQDKPINSSLELLTYTNRIITNYNRNDFDICSVVFSLNPIEDNIKNLLYSVGANSIYNIAGEGYGEYNLYAQKFALNNIISFEKPDIFLFSTTEIQREIAPFVATNIGAGLCADCTSLKIEFINNLPNLIATRPTFGGKLMAEITYKGYPNMATVREGISKIYYGFDFSSKQYKKVSLEFNSNLFMKVLDTNNMLKKEILLDKTAQIMLCAGYGIGGGIVLSKLNVLCNKLNKLGIKTSICATRKAVEAGYLPKSLQIGQTGTFVSPDLYIAFGVSGAIHHMVGCENSKTIIAVNTDTNDRISNYCDYFVECDCEEFIDLLLDKLRN